MKLNNKKAQEEMVGFALIIILVAVILLVFLGFSLRKSPTESVESYEAGSFLQSALQYTSDCRSYLGYLSVRDLIFECGEEGDCLDERNSCDVLELTMGEMLNESWDVGEENPVKGYVFQILKGDLLLNITEGNTTSSSKGASQDFARRGDLFEIYLTVYS